MERGRGEWRDGGGKAGREGGMERGRGEGREGGGNGEREGGRQGGRGKAGREGGMERGRGEWREGGGKAGREGGRQGVRRIWSEMKGGQSSRVREFEEVNHIVEGDGVVRWEGGVWLGE